MLTVVSNAHNNSKGSYALNEFADVLDASLGQDWLTACWDIVLKTGVPNTYHVKAYIRGVNMGLPLAQREKVTTWLKWATQMHTDLHKFIVQEYSLGSSIDAAEAMDAWLEKWIPGKGKLLQTVCSLGLDTNPREMRKYLYEQLTSDNVPAQALPEKIELDFF